MESNMMPYGDSMENNMENNMGMMNTSMDMQPETQTPVYQSDNMSMIPGAMGFHMVYPEVFYKLQPYVMMVCDHLEVNGYTMPTPDMAEQMTDYIYDDVLRMYPELAEYARSNENMANNDPPAAEVFSQFPGMSDRGRGMFDRDRGFRDRDFGFFRTGFRRRGLFRDMIDILILSELFNRRRRFDIF